MTTQTQKVLDPTGPDAATISGWSDRYPATVVKRTEKTVWLQRDDTQHMSGPDHDGYAYGHGQVVIFLRNYDTPVEVYTLRKNGRWVRKGQPLRGGQRCALGHRDYYRDPHF